MSQEWKQKARLHFAEQRQTGQLREIKVEEWGISVYYWPVMSLSERSAIARGYAIGPIDGLIDCLIARGRDEHGRTLFDAEEREALLERYDPEIVTRIAVAMLDAGRGDETPVAA